MRVFFLSIVEQVVFEVQTIYKRTKLMGTTSAA